MTSACGDEDHDLPTDDAPTATSWRISAEPSLVIGQPSGAFAGDLDRVRDVALLSDGAIAVADGAQRILVFGSDGSYERTIGREGQGPGEFTSLQTLLVVGGDTILAHDYRQRRASMFDRDGALIGTVEIQRSGNLLGRWTDGTLVFAEQVLQRLPTTVGIFRSPYTEWHVLHLRSDGEVLDTIAVVPGTEVLLTGRRSNPSGEFLRDTYFAFGPEEIFVATGDRFEVTAIGMSEPHGVHMIRPPASPPVRRVEPADVDLWYFVDDERRNNDEYIRAILDALPSDQTLPATRRVLRDDVGWIWLEHYPPDAEPPLAQHGYLVSRTWSAMDPDGNTVVDVVLPPRFEPIVIGQDFVLGVARDSLDVQWVHMYALEREP